MIRGLGEVIEKGKILKSGACASYFIGLSGCGVVVMKGCGKIGGAKAEICDKEYEL